MVGNVSVGGNSPISIQSMTNTKTCDIDATIAQINELKNAGCDIVRCSVPDNKSAEALKTIVENCDIPIVADIHFDYRLAIKSADAGVAKIRINPGNIGDSKNVDYLANYLKERKIPIRIGVNGGSLDKKYQGLPLDVAMCESALEHVHILENHNFDDIVISVKSSDVANTIKAYRLLSQKCDYPLHVGVTEAGIYEKGLIKSAIGIGSLLCDGIGDTIRVSLTDNPVKEVYAGREILKAIGKYDKPYAEVVSCPTCARTCIEVQRIATMIDEYAKTLNKNIKIAVMGCVVNGIGESKGCDIGVAGGKDKSVIFKDGEIVATVTNDKILSCLIEQIDKM